MFKVNTNVASMTAQRYLGQANRREENESIKLSSSDRIFRSAEDPAGLAISEKMNAHQRSMGQALRNINDSLSMVQVAESSLGGMHSIGGRLLELAIQGASDVLGDGERTIVNKEFMALKHELKRLGSNGNQLLESKKDVYSFQIGIKNNKDLDRIIYDINKILDSSNNYGMGSANLMSKTSAQSSINKVKKVIDRIGAGRAKLGALGNRLETSSNHMTISREEVLKSKSKIRDADVAQAASEKLLQTMKKNASGSMLAQANSRSDAIMNLFK